MGLVVLLSAVLLPNASAMTSRSSRLRAHPVVQEQPSRPTHTKKHAAAPHEAERPGRHAHAKAPLAAKTHSRRRHAEPVPADDPITIKRAHHDTRAARAVRTETAALRPHASRPLAPRRAEPELAAARPASGSASTNDFVRAASGNAATQGVSRPDEMDDELPVAVGTALRPRSDNAVIAAAPPVTPATRRVDGFGAEGITSGSGHRTLAKTMAAHRAETSANVPHLSGEERNEITDEAVKPMVLPAVYTRGGRIVMPAPLKGSHEVLVHQNTMADSEGLERIQDETQLEDMVDAHQLARLPESSALHLNPELPENRRYARPWTVKFAADTARNFATRFGTPIQINSAVRTVEVQMHLIHTNGNAAGLDGDTASPHLTGQAIDIGKRGMSNAQLAWMRSYLLPLMQDGKIDVEEEFHQACFHISVYRSYLPPSQRHTQQVAQIVRRSPGVPTYAPPAVEGEDQ
jgi:hypothetical protein